MIGHGKACSHIWKFATLKFVCRGCTYKVSGFNQLSLYCLSHQGSPIRDRSPLFETLCLITMKPGYSWRLLFSVYFCFALLVFVHWVLSLAVSGNVVLDARHCIWKPMEIIWGCWLEVAKLWPAVQTLPIFCLCISWALRKNKFAHLNGCKNKKDIIS